MTFPSSAMSKCLKAGVTIYPVIEEKHYRLVVNNNGVETIGQRTYPMQTRKQLQQKKMPSWAIAIQATYVAIAEKLDNKQLAL